MGQISLSEKLKIFKSRQQDFPIKIMIIGLGSVGSYLLDYLMSESLENVQIIVAGRDYDKIIKDVNIIKVATLIRDKNRSEILIESNVDLENVDSIKAVLSKHHPNIIVNSSRAYAHIKYGSISWENIRAYGLWAPLAIKYTKKIMEAYEGSGCDGIVINTSYSDGVIPWIKTAGYAFPDFGSGNINHLIPRIRFAVASEYHISDYWNIDVTYATSHFHDVVISKEGQTEGVEQLISVCYDRKELDIDRDRIFSLCKIPMPVDAKRNMMNASSNFEIIKGIFHAAKGSRIKLHSPGVFGEIGGYPVVIDGSGDLSACIDESKFSLSDMRAKNRESIYLDGIEDISEGCLYYTDGLIKKVKDAFSVDIPKTVEYSDIEKMAGYIIEKIIEKYRG